MIFQEPILPIKYPDQIEKEIKKYFYLLIFKPIIDKFNEINSLDNSIQDLINAIKKQIIYYQNGYLKGSFSARTSIEIIKYGGVWDKYQKGYAINILKFPSEILFVITHTQRKQQLLHHNILNEINKSKEYVSLNVNILYEQAIESLDKQFNFAIKNIINITPSLTKEQVKFVAKEYTNNLNFYIKDFVEKEIPILREEVQKNVFAGYRASNLERIILERYDVSKSKAKFLARQETQIMTSKYNISRAEDAGIKKYIWKTMGDNHVRHDHQLLDGKEIELNNPPVVDIKTGRKAHAGEDFGCRCYKKFVIE